MLRTILLMTALLSLPVYAHDVHEGCSCSQNEWANGWCDDHSVGYAAGLEIKSSVIAEALDFHGHQITPMALECESCRSAAAENALCERCGWGIANSRIYGSKMTYYLALGEPRDQGLIHCETCRRLAAGEGWCERCGQGWIGHFAYQERAVHTAAVQEFQLLQRALDTLARCEICALACYYSTHCPNCRITYRDGEPIEMSTMRPGPDAETK
jgi:hypothetical protein